MDTGPLAMMLVAGSLHPPPLMRSYRWHRMKTTPRRFASKSTQTGEHIAKLGVLSAGLSTFLGLLVLQDSEVTSSKGLCGPSVTLHALRAEVAAETNPLLLSPGRRRGTCWRRQPGLHRVVPCLGYLSPGPWDPACMPPPLPLPTHSPAGLSVCRGFFIATLLPPHPCAECKRKAGW
jgi:hypothetical protein